MAVAKREWRDLNGVLLLDKSTGYSSNAALQKARYCFQARKAGHTGSLDPLASGLLPVCFGEATKFSGFLLDSDKRYEVRIRLGVETDTGDSEGRELRHAPVPPLTDLMLDSVLSEFKGPILQTPPMYSALKHQGRRLYDLARQGIEVDRPARPVTIYDIKLLGFDESTLSLDVLCSKGTYIRSLAESIGAHLGCGGHVEMLRRTGAGGFSVQEAITQEGLEAQSEPEREQGLKPLSVLVGGLPRLVLEVPEALRVQHGNEIQIAETGLEGVVSLFDAEERFYGVGMIAQQGRLLPKRMVSISP